MPIISASDLRSVIGVSQSLYSDAYLDQIIASSEEILLPILNSYQFAIDSFEVKDYCLFLYNPPQSFCRGSISDCHWLWCIRCTYTVAARTDNVYMFSAAVIAADSIDTPVIPAGIAVLDGSSAADLYANNDAIKNALLGLSTDIFQAVIAPGSQIEGVDFAQTIYRTGRSMVNRQMGLLTPFLDTETICQ
jgi:hypothetical protein